MKKNKHKLQIPPGLKIGAYELIVSENCNLRCSYCFDNDYSNRTVCSYDANMSEKIIPDIIKFINATRATQYVTISFFGGEPLINFSFIKQLVTNIKNSALCKDWRTNYIIFTNGVLLNKAFNGFVKQNNISVVVSLDGNRQAHDMHRLFVSGKPSWEKIVSGLPGLIAAGREINKNVTIAYVVQNNTIKYFKESLLFLNDLDVGVNLCFYYEKISNKTINTILDVLEKLLLENKIRPPSIFSNTIFPIIGKTGASSNICINPFHTVTIAPSGKLFFCHRYTPKMHNLKMNQLACYGDIWQGWINFDYFKQMVKRSAFFEKKQQCSVCVAKSWCRGGCLYLHTWHKDKLVKMNNSMCKLFRGLTILGIKILLYKGK
jgi:uncharacterized protein